MAGYARRGIFMHGWGLDLTRASSAFENDCRYVLRACRVYRDACARVTSLRLVCQHSSAMCDVAHLTALALCPSLCLSRRRMVSKYSARAVGSEWACQAQFFIMLGGLARVFVGILPLYRCVT